VSELDVPAEHYLHLRAAEAVGDLGDRWVVEDPAPRSRRCSSTGMDASLTKAWRGSGLSAATSRVASR
jgi:hypothetical protein